MREETGIWPVRVVADRIYRSSLWFEGDTDLLPAREGRIALFMSPNTLADRVAATLALLAVAAGSGPT